MQDHNTEEYYQFLRVLYVLKCHWICCACFNVDELNNDALASNTELHRMDQNSPKSSPEDTVIETADETVKKEHSNMPQNSIDTEREQSIRLIN